MARLEGDARIFLVTGLGSGTVGGKCSNISSNWSRMRYVWREMLEYF
ncbi:hypothetical protein [Cohnella abietis]|nr:hypothetical protein [Cohnella abietis]